MSILATLLLLAVQDNDHLLINEVSDSFQRRWAAAEESKNYKELLDLYAVAHDTLKGKLTKPDPEVDRWIPVGRVLAARLASLPPEALEAHETIAKQVLETVLEPAERRKAVEKYAYTKVGREALDLMSNGDCDQGRLPSAMRGWARTLEVRPTAETVARLAFAHSVRNDAVSLATLRTTAESRGIKGAIVVEGRKRELLEYIDSLHPAQRGVPAAPDPLLRPAPAPNTEVPLGHYDLKEDGRYGERLAVSLPAAGRANGKDLVVVSNGLRVTALATVRAEGGVIDEAIEWRYPKNGPTRTWTLGTYNSVALPYVGVTVSGNRAFCPMFPERQEARQQMGRRSQRFLGPSVLRAIDLTTGEGLWDTDSVIVEANGNRVLLVDHLDLDKSDFCFGGPPVVRGDRVYSALMTSPFTGRQCWVLCQDAATGRPIWCTDVGTAPQTKEMSVALLDEDEGTVVLSTNYGVIAALNSETGAFEWLVKYMGTRPKRSQHRPSASVPVIAGSVVYVLAQDCDELLAFDRWTGLEAPLPKLTQEVAWNEVVHLIGRSDDWLVFSGPRNLAVRPMDGQVVGLPDAEPGYRFGRGTIAAGRLYLPTRAEMSVFDTRTWKLVESLKWPEPTGPGNTLVAGSLLVHMSDRVDLYTSAELLKSRFGTADGGPTRPQDSRQLARILEGAGQLKECVPYYRRALKAWENDAAWQETAETLKKKLADLAEKLGDEFPKD